MWWRLIFKEIARRKWGFLFSVAAVAVAVGALALIVAVTASLAEEARLIGTRMRQNILILPADVPLEEYHRGDFGALTIPQEIFAAVTDRSVHAMVDTSALARDVQLVDDATLKRERDAKGEKIISYSIAELADHYMAELQQRVQAQAAGRSMEVILTGQEAQSGRRRPIVEPAKPGDAYVGYAVAERLGLSQGQIINIAGKELRVERIEESQGTMDDIRVYVALPQAQQMLDRPGQINRIVALGCVCQGITIGQISQTLERHVARWMDRNQTPARVRVFAMTRLATARADLRNMISGVAAILAPIFAVICAVLVCGYFYFNVRERRTEIGVLLSIGFTPAPIVLALLFKLALVAVFGGAVGTLAGLLLAVQLGPVFLLQKVIWPAELWLWTMGLGVGLTLLAGLYPLLLAGRVRAADILRNS